MRRLDDRLGPYLAPPRRVRLVRAARFVGGLALLLLVGAAVLVGLYVGALALRGGR